MTLIEKVISVIFLVLVFLIIVSLAVLMYVSATRIFWG